MLNFYSLDSNLHQICLRDLSIYFSFKMPVAFRIKSHGLRIRKYIFPEDFRIITAGNTYLIMDQTNFDTSLKHIFKSTIYNLAEDYTKKRMGIEQEDKSKPINLGEINWNAS